MNRELAEMLIRDAGLGGVTEDVVAQLQPAIRIDATKLSDEPTHRGSKFGGQLHLPSGMKWPHRDSTESILSELRHGQAEAAKMPSSPYWPKFIAKREATLSDPMVPLSFLADIRLADLPAGEVASSLPLNGRLLFFYDVKTSPGGFDPADRGGWQVFYVLEDGPFDVLEPPGRLPAHCRFGPSVIGFQADMTLPADMLPYGLDVSIFQNTDYARLQGELTDASSPTHRIGGFAEPVQGPMELECQLVTNGIYCRNSEGYRDPRRALLEEGTKDWRLLLQLDSDDQAGFMWGDIGRLYFWIRRQDLRNRNFGNVWCIQQCH